MIITVRPVSEPGPPPPAASRRPPAPEELNDPDWLVAGFARRPDRLHLAQVDRDTYYRSPFLDHRIARQPSRVHSISPERLDQALNQTSVAPACWIFHTAFCGSTLLARLLDQPGRTMVWREPLVLTRLADALRGDPSDTPPPLAPSSSLVQTTLRSFRRVYPGETLSIVKPSNYGQNLLPLVIRQQHAASLVLMSSSLEAFLLSVLRKADEARRQLPGFVQRMAGDGGLPDRLADLPASGCNDSLIEQSALLWYLQRAYITEVMRECELPWQTVDLTELQADPAAVVSRITAGLAMVAPALKALQADPSHWRDDAKKRDRPFDKDQRRRDDHRLRQSHARDLDQAISWIDSLRPVENDIFG